MLCRVGTFSLFGVNEKFDSDSLSESESWHYILFFLAKTSLVGSDTSSSSEEQSEIESGVTSPSVFSSIIFFKSKLL